MDGAAILDAIRIFVALLGLAAIVAIVVRPLRLPYSVALVIVGLGAGLVETAIAGPEPVVPPEVVLVVLLPASRLRGRLPARPTDLRRSFAALLLLAAPGVVISAAVVAVLLNVVMGLRLDLAFIVGAMVSATDPVAVVATFRRLHVPRDLATIVEGESLLNDGTGPGRVRHRGRRPDRAARSGRCARRLRRRDRRERGDRAGGRVRRSPAHGPRRRPPDPAHDLGRAGLRDLPAGRRAP